MIGNMGTVDRAVRVVLGLVVVTAVFGWGWSFFGWIFGSVLVVVAALMFATAALGYCPTYSLLGVSTDPALHRVPRSGAKVGAHH